MKEDSKAENRIAGIAGKHPESRRVYDAESKPLDKRLTVDERPLYLKEIKKDIAYFKPSYARADLRIGIEGRDVEQAARHTLAQLQTGAG